MENHSTEIMWTSFKNASLPRANFRSSKIFWVDFSGADLTNAIFDGAQFHNVNFKNAKLDGTNIFYVCNLKNEDRDTNEVSVFIHKDGDQVKIYLHSGDWVTLEGLETIYLDSESEVYTRIKEVLRQNNLIAPAPKPSQERLKAVFQGLLDGGYQSQEEYTHISQLLLFFGSHDVVKKALAIYDDISFWLWLEKISITEEYWKSSTTILNEVRKLCNYYKFPLDFLDKLDYNGLVRNTDLRKKD